MSRTNNPEEQAFFRALQFGDAAVITQMVHTNPNLLHSYDDSNFGATPLTSVCFASRHDLACLLLDLGADPNRRSDWSMGPWSPLHCAAYRHDHALAQDLLARGATLDLHGAAALGWCDALKELLDSAPHRIHERGGDGCFPLHFADTISVAELLLERGAEIDGRCKDHHSTPAQYLCTIRPDVARYLLSRGAQADVFTATLCEASTTLDSILSAEPSLAKTHLNQTFFPPHEGHQTYNILTFTVGSDTTPLHAAAIKDNVKAMQRLLSAGAEVNARGGYDQGTPLHQAAWNNHVDAATCLIEHGADINMRSGKIHNNSPAGWAIVAGSLRVFELLMDHGAERFPWFLDDAKDACEGRFDAVSRAPRADREAILKRVMGEA